MFRVLARLLVLIGINRPSAPSRSPGFASARRVLLYQCVKDLMRTAFCPCGLGDFASDPNPSPQWAAIGSRVADQSGTGRERNKVVSAAGIEPA